MATGNRRSATVHPDPPQPRPTAAPPSLLHRVLCGIFQVVFILGFSILVLKFLWEVLIPRPPYLYLTTASVTPLSPTTAVMWNLSLQVSNPNPMSRIFYDEFNVSLFYNMNNHDDDDPEFVLIAETVLGPFVQKRNCRTLLQPRMFVSIENVASSVVSKIMDDQKWGVVGVQIRVSFFVKFIKDDNNWELMKLSCSPLTLVVDDYSFANSGLGKDFIRGCEFVDRS